MNFGVTIIPLKQGVTWSDDSDYQFKTKLKEKQTNGAYVTYEPLILASELITLSVSKWTQRDGTTGTYTISSKYASDSESVFIYPVPVFASLSEYISCNIACEVIGTMLLFSCDIIPENDLQLYMVYGGVQQQIAPILENYLTFSSPQSFTLAINNTTKNWDGILEYSINAKDWSVWDGTTTLSSGSDNKLYVRGTDNTKITGGSNNRWVLTGSNISCRGNIETLLNYQTVLNGEHPPMANYCYTYMFYDCHSLIKAPALPATTLANNCYQNMFSNCGSLTTAPKLPATTLANSCYDAMFSDCTSLITIPALPATTLATSCYSSMFYNCTKIKLSATKTGTYTKEYRIPTGGTGITANSALSYMFKSTGGTFEGTPEINIIYYLDDSNNVV